MNILFDLTHPAHLHLFKNAIASLEKSQHKVFLTVRDKDVLFQLLERMGYDYQVLAKSGKNLWSMAWELLYRDFSLKRFVSRNKIELMIGCSPNICHVSKVSSAKSIIFAEDDKSYTQLYAWVTYPFADCICTPDALSDELGKKHIKYNSYHELAYLHPENFTPNPQVLEDLGVSPGERFFIMRLVLLKAHHDVGHQGMSQTMKIRIAQELSKHGKVFISCEGELPPELKDFPRFLPIEKMHDALAFSTFYIGDSQSMAMEAAVLGTPSFRCNTFVGRISVLNELEDKYGLTYGFLPEDEEQMFTKIQELLQKKNLKEEWSKKREALLQDKMDLNHWMLNLIENYLDRGQ